MKERSPNHWVGSISRCPSSLRRRQWTPRTASPLVHGCGELVRVLVVHNYYQQPGGEDQVFAAEAHLLESHGHEVARYVLHNDQIAELSCLRLGAATVWNGSSYRNLRDIVRIW